jgi:hypothetical protein
MAIPALQADGLLPPGAHRATLAEIGAAFVQPALGDTEIRSAVFTALTTWLTLVRRTLGPGVCGVGGGFVASGELTETAFAVYFPQDEALAEVAVTTHAAIDLVSLKDVVYSYPGGGGLRERWPVSPVLDAHIAHRITTQLYRRVLAAVIGPNGLATPGVTKGYVEVEVRVP